MLEDKYNQKFIAMQGFDDYGIGTVKQWKKANDLKNSLDIKILKDKNLINKKYSKLKILGTGELKTNIDISAHFASKQASEKIQKAGGKLNLIKK